MPNVVTAKKFIPYFQKKYKVSFHKANIIFTLYEMLCKCYPNTELSQNVEDALIKTANELLEHENSPLFEAVLQEA